MVITSALCATAPALAVLPMANMQISEALRASVAGQQWMVAAGSVGICSDVAFATGAFVLMVYRQSNGSGIEASSWVWLAIINLIFVVVDALVSHVLGPIAV